MHRTTGVAALLLAVLQLFAATPVTAQADSQLWRWVDAQALFCVWYLADPEVAAELVPADIRLRPASATASVPEVLLRIVQDEPRFAEWIPGMFCVGRYSAVAADGVPAGTMDKGRPMLVTLSALAAASAWGQDAGWQLTHIGLDAGRLRDVASSAWIGGEQARVRDRTGLAGEDTQWELTLKGVKLIWSGHTSGPSRVGTTRSMSFGYAGDQNSMWLVEYRSAPSEEQPQVGALRIEGDGPLARALKSSPMRTVGPLGRGGEATLSFRRLVSGAP
jgi:hypothetical protein